MAGRDSNWPMVAAEAARLEAEGHRILKLNIGNPAPEISMKDLVARIQTVVGKSVKYDVIEYPDSYPADEPLRRSPDITKARRQLGFAPNVTLEEGLGRFLGWADETYLGIV